MVLFDYCPKYPEHMRKGKHDLCKTCSCRRSMACSAQEYISFGDVCRKEIGMQCQYGSHYLDGLNGYRNVGNGLRIIRESIGDYHSYLIHRDDAPVFVKRVKEMRDDC